MAKKKSMTSNLMLILLAVLLVFSVVQTVQIQELKTSVTEIATPTLSTSIPPTKTVRSQPTMVGGC